MDQSGKGPSKSFCPAMALMKNMAIKVNCAWEEVRNETEEEDKRLSWVEQTSLTTFQCSDHNVKAQASGCGWHVGSFKSSKSLDYLCGEKKNSISLTHTGWGIWALLSASFTFTCGWPQHLKAMEGRTGDQSCRVGPTRSLPCAAVTLPWWRGPRPNPQSTPRASSAPLYLTTALSPPSCLSLLKLKCCFCVSVRDVKRDRTGSRVRVAWVEIEWHTYQSRPS